MRINDDSEQWPRRRSIRIKGYDYTQEGAYFITICTHKKQCTLGRIIGEDIILNDWGRIVLREWNRSSAVRTEIELDSFIIMPNHVHGIVFIHPVGARGCAPGRGHPNQSGRSMPPGLAKQSLSSFVLGFKTAVTTQINTLRGTPGKPFWQRNYFEHIIRNEESLYQCRTYIEQNPLKWAFDKENPERQRTHHEGQRMNRKELAIERFRGDYNCAQSVLSVFAADYGLDEMDAYRIALPFGGGMGRLQKVCGAMTGAFMVIGLIWGAKEPENDEEKEKVYQVVRKFAARFESLHGATDCLTLLGQDISTEEGRQKAKEDDIFSQRCEKYVGGAVEILDDLLAASDLIIRHR